MKIFPPRNLESIIRLTKECGKTNKKNSSSINTRTSSGFKISITQSIAGNFKKNATNSHKIASMNS